MHKKRFKGRILGMILAGMMILESPLSATAAEFSDAPVQESVSEESLFSAGDAAVQNEDTFAGNVAEQPAEGFSDEGAAAQAYLQENYVTNNKVITTGGDGVVKSENGLTYSIGLKTPSGSSISSIRLKNEGSSSSYISGWVLNADAAYLQSRTATSTSSRSILSRPTGAAYSFSAVLSLYAAGTDKTTIDDGTATALAVQTFTFVLEPEAATYQVNFQAVNKDTKEAISGEVITLEKDWSTVTPNMDGSYSLPGDAIYTVKATASGYQDYSNASFQATESGTVTLEMTPIVMSTINFDVKDSAGNAIEGATVSVKKGYYTTIEAEADGSYQLQNGVEYSYTVSAENYNPANGTIIPTESTTVPVTLEQNITVYTVTFQAASNADQTPITGAVVTVTYEGEDDYGEPATLTVDPQEDGTYLLDKGTEYTYSVTAEGYETASGTLSPDGTSSAFTKTVLMKADALVAEEDQAAVDAVKAKFDSEFGALRPIYGTDANAAALVQSKIQAYADVTGASNVTVTLNTTDETTYVAEDGTIHYVQADTLNAVSAIYFKNISCTFAFHCGNAQALSSDRTVTIGWDRPSFEGKMQTEADQLTEEAIAAANTNLDLNSVTGDFQLPQCMGTSLQKVWSVIDWSVSDSSVITLEDTGYGSKINPKKAVVHAQEEDTTVTLTAVFSANDTLLNSYLEKTSDFATITKEFTVTVKGTGVVKPTEEELKAILDQYYTADLLMDFTDKTQRADLTNCQGDIQLPRYTTIKDAQGNLVFANKEIVVTSDNTDIITISGYRANVDIFQEQEKPVVNLVVTFTRDGVTAVKQIPVTVGTITEEMLDAEIAMLDTAKAHYFDGINDGQNTDKDSVINNLHAFAEMTLDGEGNPVWTYAAAEKTGKGITPDDYFTDSVEMESAGYNHFKSSNPSVIRHENLLVTRANKTTQVTISTLLSSERYGKFAVLHPENEKLAKLYKQEASVTVTVLGTETPADILNEKITQAGVLLNAIVEGTNPGEYPEGTKAELETAIANAAAVANKENATEEELTEAYNQLAAAYKKATDSQIAAQADVTISITKDTSTGQPDAVVTTAVRSDAAEKAGYTKAEEFKNQITVLDALVVYHQNAYGLAFETAPEDYLKVAANGAISRIFGIDTYNLGYYVNHGMSSDYSNACVLSKGDTLDLFLYGDPAWGDKYVYMENANQTIKAGIPFSFTVKASGYDSSFATVTEKAADCVVALEDENHLKQTGTTDAEGVVTFTAAAPGIYKAEIQTAPYSWYMKAAPMILTVTEGVQAPEITAQPESGTYLVNAASVKNLTVSAVSKDEGALSYQWYSSQTKDGTFEKIETNGIAAAYTPEKFSESNTTWYYCTVTNSIEVNGTSYTNTADTNKVSVKFETLGEQAGWEGEGTESAPYLLKTTEDLAMLAKLVNETKMTFAGQYLTMAADLTLPASWVPVGTSAAKFAGTFDGGNHLLTVPAGEKCLLGYTSKAVLKNLNIYGTQIVSEGVVDNYEVGTTISIENVTLKEGTQTLCSGFIGGYASGSNAITITDCTVEQGVVIGYDRSQTNIGSFGGDFNGTIQGCTSAATVYGVKYVGGICGNKGQSMGDYKLIDCQFNGTVIASGNYVGGISGGGYGGTRWGESSAKNTPGVTIQNCTANASVTGADYVGGILGSETGMVQCWVNGTEYIQNNTFTGTVTATEGTYAGGVIGYLNGIDKYNVIEGNKCFVDGMKGIGFIRYIDTSYEDPTEVEGVTYYNTENGKPANAPGGASKTQHNRTDDPLGADAAKLAKSCMTVTFSLLGDAKHDSDHDGQVHSLADGNLETWIAAKEYEVDYSANVKDVLEAVLAENNMTCRNEAGNYVQGITKDGVELSEFDNGRHSGWMYTLNGVHPELSIVQQKLTPGDVIVFHYTDDYDREHVHQWSDTWSGDNTAHWHDCTDEWCPLTDDTKKDGYALHTVEKWETVSYATVFEPKVRKGTCTVCGMEVTRTEGTKLTPTVKLNVKSLLLQKKQSTSAVKVSGLAKGDSVKSWKSSNTKIVKVSQDGKITAQNKKGEAVITVTLASGKTTKLTVTVQTAAVTTTKISGLSTKVTVKKGKTLELKPVISPITSKQKVSYVSGNTKVATVSSTGVIKAKKAGTAKITVKSGTKSFVVTVSVPKTKTKSISGVPAKLTISKGKTKTLAAVVSPSNSDEKLSFTTSKSSVVTVSSTGKLTAKKKGTAVITVTSGKITVTCKVTVK